MNALTLWEPWASLVACGAKRLETRSWRPPASAIGQRLAIAAAARPPRDGECPGSIFRDGLGNLMYAFPTPWTEEEQVAAGLEPDGDLLAIPLHPGKIVASAMLADAIPVVGNCGTAMDVPPHLCHSLDALLHHRPRLSPFLDGETEHVVTDQLPFGDFTPGRFGLPLQQIRNTLARCPWCWSTPVEWIRESLDGNPCVVCAESGSVDPIPARGRQRFWKWNPEEELAA